MTPPQEKAECVSQFIETKSEHRLRETTELSKEEIHPMSNLYRNQ